MQNRTHDLTSFTSFSRLSCIPPTPIYEQKSKIEIPTRQKFEFQGHVTSDCFSLEVSEVHSKLIFQKFLKHYLNDPYILQAPIFEFVLTILVASQQNSELRSNKNEHLNLS